MKTLKDASLNMQHEVADWRVRCERLAKELSEGLEREIKELGEVDDGYKITFTAAVLSDLAAQTTAASLLLAGRQAGTLHTKIEGAIKRYLSEGVQALTRPVN